MIVILSDYWFSNRLADRAMPLGIRSGVNKQKTKTKVLERKVPLKNGGGGGGGWIETFTHPPSCTSEG